MFVYHRIMRLFQRTIAYRKENEHLALIYRKAYLVNKWRYFLHYVRTRRMKMVLRYDCSRILYS